MWGKVYFLAGGQLLVPMESRSSHWIASSTGAASEPVWAPAGCQDPFSSSSPGPWACVADEFHSKAA